MSDMRLFDLTLGKIKGIEVASNKMKTDLKLIEERQPLVHNI